jgi:hypothetical protein
MVVIDEYARQCLATHVTRCIRARDAIDMFANLMETHGIPEHIRPTLDSFAPIQVNLTECLLSDIAENAA